MNRKILFLSIIFSISIIVAGCTSGQQKILKDQIKKCGDGICDAKEKANPKFCPEDCGDASLDQGADNMIPPDNTAGGLSPDQESNAPNYSSPFGIHPAVPVSEAINAGIKWTRGSGGTYVFWSFVDPNMTGDSSQFKWQGQISDSRGKSAKFDYDTAIGGMNDAGMEILHNIEAQPAGQTQYRKQGSWLPANEEAYAAFVKEAVKRYPYVKYWQIGNEPMASRESDYGKFISITYDAIKEANPAAKVLPGGVAGMGMPQSFAEYQMAFDKSYLPLLQDIAKQKKRCFDIFDFHWFGDGVDDYKTSRAIRDYISKKIKELGIPEPEEFWITETGTYSGDPKIPEGKGDMSWKKYQSEKQQASDLIKRYVYPFSSGIKKVFWAWGLKEGFKNNEEFFDFTGLIYDGKFSYDQGQNVKKLSYYSYKKMTETLEGSDWNNIQTVQELGGIYIYKFTKNNKSIWVAWNDNANSQTISLNVGDIKSVKITEAVPKYETGKEVSNYSAAFNTETKSANNGKISITLGDKPVFIE